MLSLSLDDNRNNDNGHRKENENVAASFKKEDRHKG
jgi:hypothetical protein